MIIWAYINKNKDLLIGRKEIYSIRMIKNIIDISYMLPKIVDIKLFFIPKINMSLVNRYKKDYISFIIEY